MPMPHDDERDVQNGPGPEDIVPEQGDAEPREGDAGAGEGQSGSRPGHQRPVVGEDGALIGEVGSIDGKKTPFHHRRQPIPAKTQLFGASHRFGAGAGAAVAPRPGLEDGGAEGRLRGIVFRTTLSHFPNRDIPDHPVHHHHQPQSDQQDFHDVEIAHAEDPEQQQPDRYGFDAGADKRQPRPALGERCAVMSQIGTILGQHRPQFGKRGSAGGRGKTGIDVLLAFDHQDDIGRESDRKFYPGDV